MTKDRVEAARIVSELQEIYDTIYASVLKRGRHNPTGSAERAEQLTRAYMSGYFKHLENQERDLNREQGAGLMDLLFSSFVVVAVVVYLVTQPLHAIGLVVRVLGSLVEFAAKFASGGYQ